MQIQFAVFAAALGLAVTFFGCGGGSNGDTPVTPGEDPVRLQQAETELADVEKEIAAKEVELAKLRQRADELRQEIADVSAPADSGGGLSLEKLLEGLPADARPKNHDDTVRIDRANDWLAANAVGKQVEFLASVGDVRLTRGADKRYSVDINNNFDNQLGVKVHGLNWITRVRTDVEHYAVRLEGIDEADAEELSALKRKSASFAGTIKSAAFGRVRGSIELIIPNPTVKAAGP